MAKSDYTPEEIAQLHAGNLLDTGQQLREEYTEFLSRRDANRMDLRNAAKSGYLNDEQLAEMEELYPARRRSETEVDGMTNEPNGVEGGE